MCHLLVPWLIPLGTRFVGGRICVHHRGADGTMPLLICGRIRKRLPPVLSGWDFYSAALGCYLSAVRASGCHCMSIWDLQYERFLSYHMHFGDACGVFLSITGLEVCHFCRAPAMA